MYEFKYIPKEEGRRLIRKEISDEIEFVSYTDVDLKELVEELQGYINQGANKIDFSINGYSYDDKELGFQCFEQREETEEEYLDRLKKEHDKELSREECEQNEKYKKYLKAKEFYLENKDKFE